MPAPSEPPTRRSAPEKAVARRTRAWDLPTRIFHWTLAAAVIAQIALHVLAVLLHVLVKRHRLVRPMLDGDKLLEDRTDAAASRDDAASPLLALAVFAACAAFAAFATWIATLRS